MGQQGGRGIRVNYRVFYNDESWRSPCTERYEINNFAEAQGITTGMRTNFNAAHQEISDRSRATVVVNTVPEAYVQVQYYEVVNTVYTKGGSAQLELLIDDIVIGYATAPVFVDIERPVIFMTDKDYPSVTEITAENQAHVAWIPAPTANTSFEIRVLLPDGYVAYTLRPNDMWTRVPDSNDVGSSVWFGSSQPFGLSESQPGQYCGATTVNIFSRPSTGLNIHKTGSEAANARFYAINANDQSLLLKFDDPVFNEIEGHYHFSRVGLSFGSWVVFEVTQDLHPWMIGTWCFLRIFHRCCCHMLNPVKVYSDFARTPP